MNLLLLLGLEYRKIRNDLGQSLEKKRFIASYILLLVSLIFLHQGLHILLFKVIGSPDKLLIMDLWNAQPLNTILSLSMIYSVLRGIISSDFVNQFDTGDIQMLFSTPFPRRDIHLSKYFVGFSRRLVLFALLFTSINPIFAYLEIIGLNLLTLFLVVFIFIEVNHVLGDIFYLAFHSLLAPYLKNRDAENQSWVSLLLITLGVIISLFFLIPGNAERLTRAVNPAYLVTDAVSALLRGSASTSPVSEGLVVLTLVYVAFAAVSYLLGFSFDLRVMESIRDAEEQSHNLLTSLVNWDGVQRLVDIPPVLLKDIVSFTREHGRSIILELVINYGVFALFLRSNFFPTVIPLEGYTNLYLIAPPLVTILILNLVSPSTELLTGEVETMWLIKSSGTSMNTLFISKYVLSIAKSFLFSLPLILMGYLESPINNMIIIFLIINVVFIYNALGLLVTSFFLVDSRNFFTGTFSLHFIQIVCSFVITGLYVSLLFLHPGTVLLIFNIVIALSITEYYVSNSFVVFDFLTKFYLVGLISFYATGLLFVFVASRANFLSITLSSLFNIGLFLVISSVITYNVLRLSSRLTARNLADYDDF
jgi:hypothetical protein